MFLNFEETLILLGLCGSCHGYKDECVRYETCDVHAVALSLCLRVSGSCKPSELRVFSMSILLLRRVRKIHTHHCPKVRIISEPAAQSCTAQETQPIPHNPRNRKNAYQQ